MRRPWPTRGCCAMARRTWKDTDRENRSARRKTLPLYPPQIQHEQSRFCVKEHTKKNPNEIKTNKWERIKQAKKESKEKGTKYSKK
jgi:hypothetical protein